MGARDTHDVMTQVDRWVFRHWQAFPDSGWRDLPPEQVATMDTHVRAAVEEQDWGEPAEILMTLRARYQTWLAHGGLKGWQPGWRVWTADGSRFESYRHAWADVPHGIVGGVRYTTTPGVRWLVQGTEPFWINPADGLLYDRRTHTEAEMYEAHLRRGHDVQRRWGVWVDDTTMRRFRWCAVTSFGLTMDQLGVEPFDAAVEVGPAVTSDGRPWSLACMSHGLDLMIDAWPAAAALL